MEVVWSREAQKSQKWFEMVSVCPMLDQKTKTGFSNLFLFTGISLFKTSIHR